MTCTCFISASDLIRARATARPREDIEMCRYIARKYALPFEVVSLHEEYWENVMEYALRTVRQGLTPNPDVMCNKMIKFGF